MRKIAIVYWSGTGNTAAMSEAVLAGIKDNGAEGTLLTATEFDASMMDRYDSIAFGCPSMGAEELEESEFEPMFSGCTSKLNGRKIALFGSYGWGDGQWMRDWEDACRDAGAVLACESVICCQAPDDEAIDACKALGRALI